MRLIILVIFTLLLATGCSSDENRFATIQEQLIAAQQRWQENEPEYYRYNYNQGCFCGVSGTYDISVLNGEFILARSLTSDEADNHLSEQFKPFLYSVTESFQLIQQAINSEAYILEVSFDSQYGYPTAINIDGDINIADDELNLSFQFTETGPADNILDDISYWKLAGLPSNDASTPPLYDTELTVGFNMENRVITGNAGCNTYSADFTIEDDQLKITNISSTDSFCLEPAAIMDQEFNFFAALSGDHTLEFNSYQLTLSKFTDMNLLLVPQTKTTEQTLSILSFRKSCDIVEVGEMLCRVIENSNNEDELFPDTINDFAPQWGTNYEVAVQVLELPYNLIRIGNELNEYFLLSVLSVITDDVGTLYRDDNFFVSQNTFREADNSTYRLVDSTLFTCADTVDCTQLTSLYLTNSLIDVTFRYTGNQTTPLELVSLISD